MNLRELRRFVITQALMSGLNLTELDAPMIDDLINAGYKHFGHETGILKKAVSLTTSASYDAYSLPTDIDNLIRVEYASSLIKADNIHTINEVAYAASSASWS